MVNVLNFSIIITVYNKEKTLEKCLNSIIVDFCRDYEIIILDDGSTDNSKGICHEFINDSRIKYFYKTI